MKKYTIIDLCWGGHGFLLNSQRHIQTDAERRSIWLRLLFTNTSCLQQLFYYILNVCYTFHAILAIKTIEVTGGSSAITWRSDVTSR